jgi:hypothetical protein
LWCFMLNVDAPCYPHPIPPHKGEGTGWLSWWGTAQGKARSLLPTIRERQPQEQIALAAVALEPVDGEGGDFGGGHQDAFGMTDQAGLPGASRQKLG